MALPPAPRTNEPAAEKAQRYLVTGRLTVTLVSPHRVEAWCKGDGAVHHLGFANGGWHCSCQSWSAQCSHLRALRLVVAVDL